jgi:hypothetical protein
VRVGRAAIDEDAIRLLEQHNPDVQFDWTHILKPTPPTPAVESAPERSFEPAQGRTQRRIERRAFPRVPESPAPMTHASPEAPVARGAITLPAAVPVAADEAKPGMLTDTIDDATAAAEAEDVLDDMEEAPVELAAEERTSAAYQRLGSEALARLRARYAEVMARITDRPIDDAAKEELKLRAERLNPDGWVTADEVERALEQYESVFEGLRALVGTRRRRRRRRKNPTQGA